MKSLHAFIKKETMEQFRSGRLMILGVLFVLLGVMNPAVAKITPLPPVSSSRYCVFIKRSLDFCASVCAMPPTFRIFV